MIPFPPVVEPDLAGAFIAVHPKDIPRPHGISIPWLTGLTSDEGAMKSARMLRYSDSAHVTPNSIFMYSFVAVFV